MLNGEGENMDPANFYAVIVILVTLLLIPLTYIMEGTSVRQTHCYMVTHGSLLWPKFQTSFTYLRHLTSLHACSWMGTPNRLILYLSYSLPGPPNRLIMKPFAPGQRACGASETSENSSSGFPRHRPRRKLMLNDVNLRYLDAN